MPLPLHRGMVGRTSPAVALGLTATEPQLCSREGKRRSAPTSPEQHQESHRVAPCRAKKPTLLRCHLPAGLALQETERKFSVRQGWSITSYWGCSYKRTNTVMIKPSKLLVTIWQWFVCEQVIPSKPLYFLLLLWRQEIVKYVFWTFVLGKEKRALRQKPWMSSDFYGYEMDPENQRVLIEVSVTACNYFHSKLWHRYLLRFLKQQMQQY